MSTESTEAIAQDKELTAAEGTNPQAEEATSQPNPVDNTEDWFKQAAVYQPLSEETSAETQASAGVEAPAQPVAGETPPQEEGAEEPGSEPAQVMGESDDQYRRRVRTTDPMLAEVLKLQAEDPDTPFDQLQAQAKRNIARQIGVELPEAEAEQFAAEESQDDGRPKTLAELESRLDQLMEEKVQAMEVEYDLKKAGQIEREMHQLEKYGKTLGERERHAQTQEQTHRANAFQGATDKAISYYPDAAVEGSALHTEILRLDKIMRDTEDSRVSSPEYPWKLVKLAAANRNVAPVDPNASKEQPAQSPTKAVAPTKSAAPIAPGNARNDAPQPPGPDPLQGVQNEADYWNAAQALREGKLSLSNG